MVKKAIRKEAMFQVWSTTDEGYLKAPGNLDLKYQKRDMAVEAAISDILSEPRRMPEYNQADFTKHEKEAILRFFGYEIHLVSIEVTKE